jgi:hypothetical protein
LARQRAIQIAHTRFLRGNAEDRVFDDVDFGPGFGQPLPQFGHVAHTQALVIHDDEKRRGIEPAEVFLR